MTVWSVVEVWDSLNLVEMLRGQRCEGTAWLMAEIRRMRGQTDGERDAGQVETKEMEGMRDKRKEKDAQKEAEMTKERNK